MGLEGICRSSAYYQFSEMRAEKALESPQPLHLGHLILDALLKRAVPLRKLNRLRFESSGLLLNLVIKSLHP